MNNRMLGALAMLCAPALLVEVMITGDQFISMSMGIASMVFMFGSLCSHIGLWRIGAAGTRWWGRTALGMQIGLVSLAFLFGFFEATSLLGEDNIVFIVTDMAWPISMVFMLIVGATALAARRLGLPYRFAPLLCGTALPLTMVFVMALGLDMGSTTSSFIFFGMTTVFWGLLGLTVFQSDAARTTNVTAHPRMA